MRIRVPAFWQAVIVLVGAALIFSWAFPPFMPRSLMITYIMITLIGLVLYFSSDDLRWNEFRTPIISTLRDDDKTLLRWSLLIILSLLPGYAVYDAVKPSLDKPLELRQVHPSPPAAIKVFDRSFDLAKLENPVRMRVLDQLENDVDAAWNSYQEAINAGSLVYYSN